MCVSLFVCVCVCVCLCIHSGGGGESEHMTSLKIDEYNYVVLVCKYVRGFIGNFALMKFPNSLFLVYFK